MGDETRWNHRVGEEVFAPTIVLIPVMPSPHFFKQTRKCQ